MDTLCRQKINKETIKILNKRSKLPSKGLEKEAQIRPKLA